MAHLSFCSSLDDTMTNYPHCDCGENAPLRYEGRAFRDGQWLPWHPIHREVYEARQKWTRDGYEVRSIQNEKK